MPTDLEVEIALGVALGLVALTLYRLLLWFHPAVVEAELIVESESAVVEAERIVQHHGGPRGR